MRRILIAMGLVLLSASPGRAQLVADTFIASGLTNPIGFVQDPLNPNVQFVIEQSGRIRVIQSGVLLAAPFLDLSVGSISCCGERGLLGLAFPPDTATSGRFYVNFTNLAGHTVIARFTRSADPLVANALSRFDLRWGSPTGDAFITQPAANHNGGSLNFGSDGYLYIGMGDGGGGNDPQRRAQDREQLLGKMLRIDVNVLDSDPQGYVVPADNPFVGSPPTKPEIWAFGLRNPWKFNFDDGPGGTGAMIIGDVGQGAWEEVDYEPAGAGGRNYGWVVREGAHNTGLQSPPPGAPTPLTDPIVEYSHSVGFSITGGFVYRGTTMHGFDGRYFYADFSTGRVWSVAVIVDPMTGEGTAADLREHTSELLGGASLGLISSFGRDSQGNLYLVRYAGSILKIRRTPHVTGVTLTPDRSAPQAPGTTINWTAAPSGGVTPYQYKWWVYDGVNWTMVKNWSTSNTFAWTPNAANPNYVVAAWVKSAGNPADAPDAVPSIPFAIAFPPPVTGVTLTADRSAPQAPGTTITWTAAPSGGVAPYQYKWWVYDGTGWTMVKDWSTSNAFAWTPNVANPNYYVAAWVKSAGQPADAADTFAQVQFTISGSNAPVTSVTLTPDRSAPQAPGTTIMWTAAPVGGVMPYQYKWWVYDGAGWTMVKDWSTSNAFAWTPNVANPNYYVAVWVKSAGHPADAPDTFAQVQFPISGPPVTVTSVALTPDRTAPQMPGTTITWTAIPTGGSAPYQYKYWIYDGMSWTPTAWTGSNTFVWTPTMANPNYHVAVWAKSAGNAADSPEAVQVVPFGISYSNVTSVTLTPDRSAPQAPGTTITWTATPSGGGPPYQYKWWIYDGASWTPGAWTSSNTFMWTPTIAGANYQVGVWVKSAGNAADAPEAVKAVPFPIGGT